MKKYALISVYDKQGVVNFSRKLVELGYSIISTGGTAKVLKENNVGFTPIQEITGNPESFDGRMKTISFQIESGILYDRTNSSHVSQAKSLNISPIDIVACNLYPFEKTIEAQNVTLNQAIEHIDVGGPTMVRAAAKNFKHVIVIVHPSDYENVIASLLEKKVSQRFKQELAAKAFQHLSFYDAQIAQFLTSEQFPQEITLPGRKLLDLRYGENPHQQSAVYIRPGSKSSLEHLQKLWGRELSLINITDINAGLESVRQFKEPAAVVIKHNSPSGIAIGDTPRIALQRAIEADPESAFGGIIVLNTAMDMQTAMVIGEFKDERRGNIDIVAAPHIDADCLSYLKNVRKTMGIYTFGDIPHIGDLFNIKWIDGGFILQTADNSIANFADWKVVTQTKPSPAQMRQMQIAWQFISRIKSNSVIIVDAQLPMTRGIGSGQTSRIRSTKIALHQAGNLTKGAILASDSFFPFSDSVILAAENGIAAIVQQGGSIRDQDSIDEANKVGIAMVFTGKRAFWH